MYIGEMEFGDELDFECEIFISADGYIDKDGAIKIIEHLKEVFCIVPDKTSDTDFVHLDNVYI